MWVVHVRYILTHPGSAHKDDFLACSILADIHQVPIVRREPVAEELDDPSVCVVDTGGEHAPERNNFDHHQLPAESVPTCALTLILQHIGIYEDARRYCEWLEPAEWFDTRGPIETAQWLGIEREVLHQLNSPIDITLLRRFAMAEQLLPGEPLWQIMQYIGEDTLGYIRKLHDRMRFLSNHIEIWEIPGSGGEIVVYLPRTEPMPRDPSVGLSRFVDQSDFASNVRALVYPDRRGQGYGLSRFNDHPAMEFTLIEQEEDVHFAHARGFMAKTSTSDPERLRALVSLAFRGKNKT